MFELWPSSPLTKRIRRRALRYALAETAEEQAQLDAESLASDWRAVGDELYAAMSIKREESSR